MQPSRQTQHSYADEHGIPRPELLTREAHGASSVPPALDQRQERAGAQTAERHGLRVAIRYEGIRATVTGRTLYRRPLIADATPPAPCPERSRFSVLLLATVAVVTLLGRTTAADDGASNWSAQVFHTAGTLSGVVNAIGQDHKGYLWLATSSGLVRFDGSTFAQWGSNSEPALPTQNASAFLVDRDGSFWIGLSGWGVWRVSNGVADTPGNHPRSFVNTLLQTRDGTVWSGGRAGLLRFQQNEWRAIDAGLPRGVFVFALLEDPSGDLWVGTEAGVFRGQGSPLRFRSEDPSIARSLSKDASGSIWAIDPSHGLRRLHPAPHVTFAGEPGVPLLHDHVGGTWIGTIGRGVRRLPARGQTPTDLGVVGESVEDESVSALFEDRDGNVWVSTRTSLIRFFTSAVRILANRDGLLSSNVLAVDRTPNGDVWAATLNGLHLFKGGDPARVRSYRLEGTEVMTLHSSAAGQLWVAVRGGFGVFAQGRFTPQQSALHNPSGSFYTMASDTTGSLWLCQITDRVSRWRGSTLESLGDVGALRGRQCTAVRAGRRGRVWIGFGDGGLVLVNDGEFKTFSTGDGLSGGRVAALHLDASDTLWVATNRGLTRFVPGHAVTIDERNGLPSANIIGVTETSDGVFLVAVDSAVLRIDKSEFDRVAADRSHQVRYTSYEQSSGLAFSPVSSPSPVAMGSAGFYWVTTVRGVAVIDVNRLGAPFARVALELQRVMADGEVHPIRTALRLPPKTRMIQIDYACLSLSYASKVRFSYRLEGFDDDWVDAGVRRQASYIGLAPGTYRFTLRALIDGKPEATLSQELVVEPAYYQQWWFYALISCAAGLSLWAAWDARVRFLRRRFEAISSERARIGRELHDTLLQNMAGAALRLESIAKDVDTSVAKAALRRLRRQIEHSLQEARELIFEIRQPGNDRPSLTDELQDLPSCLGDAPDPRCTVTVIGEPVSLSNEQHRELLRIAQEATRNAFVHSGATHISVVLSFHPDRLQLTVADDGCGFPMDEVSHHGRPHWGILGMQERAQKLGARLTITSSVDRGTRVELALTFSTRRHS